MAKIDDAVFEQELFPLLSKLKTNCMHNKIPLFISIVLNNKPKKTTNYFNAIIVPAVVNRELENDLFSQYIRVWNGYIVSLPVTKTEDIPTYNAEIKKHVIFEEEIKPILTDIKAFCEKKKAPFFISLSLEHGDGAAEYLTCALSPEFTKVTLADDKITKFLKIHEGYVVTASDVYEI